MSITLKNIHKLFEILLGFISATFSVFLEASCFIDKVYIFKDGIINPLQFGSDLVCFSA
jgi:hypothetical protein